ncbi:MAG: bifunctional phosphopantothenoylcysteine decarboxylase/phosphopantothenate--cysteine ligase CoaBC [Vulcanimicrobiaceae bacterium]
MRVVLGVAGGIAAYKAAALCSTLVQRGDEVDVVMTESARRFIAPLTFAALTHRPVLEGLWDAPESIPHMALARGADAIAIVPATANAIAKLALGIADDLLGTIALAARVPLVVAPAMNTAMYEHPATRGHLATLAARGVTIVSPGVGFLAERESGVGRLADLDAILTALDSACVRSRDLAGERVLITAGPTREALDAVRFISNASTGTMGIELARAALARGADVDLVLGPTLVEPPRGVRLARVNSARDMYDATLAWAPGATIAIATAAVSDFRPVRSYGHKVKKDAADLTLALERTPDILAALARAPHGTFVVGFAAETHDAEVYARDKLQAKALDAIAVNDIAAAGIGFGPGENDLVLLWPGGGREALGRAPKAELAHRLWSALLRVRAARAESANT